MCSDYQRTKASRAYLEEFSALRLPLRFPEPHAAPNMQPQPEVRPTDQAPIFRVRGDGVEMVSARWWQAWLFSAKAFAAVCLALYIALWFDMPRPYWAMTTVYVVSHPFAGPTLHRPFDLLAWR
jgi:hypothetical protein